MIVIWFSKASTWMSARFVGVPKVVSAEQVKINIPQKQKKGCVIVPLAATCLIDWRRDRLAIEFNGRAETRGL